MNEKRRRRRNDSGCCFHYIISVYVICTLISLKRLLTSERIKHTHSICTQPWAVIKSTSSFHLWHKIDNRREKNRKRLENRRKFEQNVNIYICLVYSLNVVFYEYFLCFVFHSLGCPSRGSVVRFLTSSFSPLLIYVEQCLHFFLSLSTNSTNKIGTVSVKMHCTLFYRYSLSRCRRHCVCGCEM